MDRLTHNDDVQWRRQLMRFRGKCKEFIGCDIDPVVLENLSVDRAFVIGTDGHLDLEDNSIDLIVSDHTFEHIDIPEQFVTEIKRVLKPGGWLCARTPNRWGYISIAASLIPNRLHVFMLRFLQPGRQTEDVFPTRYKLNSQSALKSYFVPAEWSSHSYYWNAEPAYFGKSIMAWRAAIALSWILPQRMSMTLLVFLQKKDV